MGCFYNYLFGLKKDFRLDIVIRDMPADKEIAYIDNHFGFATQVVNDIGWQILLFFQPFGNAPRKEALAGFSGTTTDVIIAQYSFELIFKIKGTGKTPSMDKFFVFTET